MIYYRDAKSVAVPLFAVWANAKKVISTDDYGREHLKAYRFEYLYETVIGYDTDDNCLITASWTGDIEPLDVNINHEYEKWEESDWHFIGLVNSKDEMPFGWDYKKEVAAYEQNY